VRTFDVLFAETKKKYKRWSSYLCFCKTIADRKMTREDVTKWFKKLVNKEDYDKKDAKTLINYAFSMCKEKKSKKV
jgi:hypothetical protein